MQAFIRDLASLRDLRAPSDRIDKVDRDNVNLPPATAWGAFTCLVRAGGVAALSMSALAGTVLAWWSTDTLDIVSFLFLAFGTLTFIASIHLLTDFADFRRCRDLEDATIGEPCVGSFCLVAYGVLPQGAVRVIGILALLISAFCTGVLTYLSGWPVLFFYALQLLLGLGGIIKPLRLNYRVWLYGEVSTFLIFGVLSIVTAVYTQSGALTLTALWLSLPFGLLSVATVHNYNLIYYRRDWLSRKRTLAVLAGIERGIDLSALLALLGLASVVGLVSFKILPLWVLIMLGALPAALSRYGDINREYLNGEDCFAIYRSVIHATVFSGILFALALMLDSLR